MGEPWKHYTRWREPDMICHILFDSIIWNIQNGQIYRNRNQIRDLECLERYTVVANLDLFFFSGAGVDENVLKLGNGECHTSEYTTNHWTNNFEIVNFVICRYLKKNLMVLWYLQLNGWDSTTIFLQSNSVLLYSWRKFLVHTCHVFFIHSSVVAHPSWFHDLVNMNISEINWCASKDKLTKQIGLGM